MNSGVTRESAVASIVTRALAGAVLVLALSGCVRLDLHATLTDHNTADGTLVIALSDDPMPSGEATPAPEVNPAEGIISDWAGPIALATFLVFVLGGLVTYIVSRRQRTRQADQAQA